MKRLKLFYFFIISVFYLLDSMGFAQKLELVYQNGHTGTINAVAISPDGKLAVSGGQDNTLKLWEIESGRLLRTLFDPASFSIFGIKDVQFSPDGKFILAITENGIMLWEVVSGLLAKSFRLSGVASIAFSPDSKTFITGGWDRVIRLWDVNTGKVINTFKGEVRREKGSDTKFFIYGHQSPIRTVAFSSNGEYIISGDGEYIISGDGECIISGDGEGIVILWKVATGQIERCISPLIGMINSVAISPDNQYALIGGENSCFQIVELLTGINKISQAEPGVSITKVQYSSNGQYFLAAKSSGIVEIRKSATTELFKILKIDESKKRYAGRFIKCATFTPDNANILTCGNDLLLWKLRTGEIFRNLKSNQYRVDRTHFYSTGAKLLFAANDTLLKFFDFSVGKLASISNHSSSITSMSISSDDSFLFTGSYDGSLNLLELSQKNRIKTFESHRSTILSTAFSVDGHFCYSVSDSILKIWDVDNDILKDEMSFYLKPPKVDLIALYDVGEMITQMFTHKIVKFSSLNNYLLSDTSIVDKTMFNNKKYKYIKKSGLKLFNIASSKWVKLFNNWHKGIIRAATFSPDGNQAISGGDDNIIILWDVQKGKKIRDFKGHQSVITALCFSPDGQMLLSGSGSADRTIKLWNAQNGKLLNTFDGHQAGIKCLTFSPDGKKCISGSRDNTIKLWDVAQGNELATFFFFEGDEWLMITPDGRFDGTLERVKELYYVQGLDIIPVDAFFEDFYSPGLLTEVFSSEPRFENEVSKIMAQQIQLPPLVEMVTPENQQAFMKKNIKIQVKATNQGGGIEEIRLYQNGKLVQKTPKGFNPNVQTGENVVTDFEIELVPGLNKFRVTAFNSDRIEAVPANISVDCQAPIPQGDLYVLAIGITEYKNKSLNLNFARPDAMQFKSLFENQKNLIFKNIFITDIYDQLAVREKIMKTMDELSGKIKAEDAFMLFFAGHGVLSSPQMSQPSQYYLALHDVSTLTDGGTPEKTGISTPELGDYFRKIKAQKQLLIVEACHVTGNANVFALGRMTPEKALIQLARDTGVRVLAFTGNSQQIAEFDELGHSIFSQAFATGFAGEADAAAGDGTITVKELALYLNDIIPELSQKHRGIMQYPNSWIGNEDFSLGIVNK